MHATKNPSASTSISVLILAEKVSDVLLTSIRSLDWATEVLVIDTSPEKNLQTQLPPLNNLRILHVKEAVSPINDFATARNTAQKLAKHDWILWLDSDELLDPSSASQIMSLLNSSDALELVSVTRRDVAWGEELKHGEGNQRIIRIGKKDTLKFEHAVHETAQSDKPTYHSSIVIKHFAHSSINSFIAKISHYSRIAASTKKSTILENTLELATFPLTKFLYTFVFKAGFLDGWRGFIYSFCMSLHSLFVRIHRYEILLSNQGQSTINPFKKYSWLAWVFVLLFSLGQLQRVQLTPLVSIYAHDIFIVFWLGLFLTDASKKIRGMLNKMWIQIKNVSVHFKLLFFWIVLGMFAAFVTNFDVVPLLYFSRILVYSLFILSLFTLLPREQLQKMWLVTGVVAAFTGIVQWAMLPDTRFLQVFGWDPHFYRLIGTFFDPAFTGMILALALVFWQTNTLLKDQSRVRLIGSSSIALALGLTYSRSTYLALAIGVLIFVGFQILKLKPSQIHVSAILKIARPWILYGLLAVAAIVLAPKPGGEGVNLARTASVTARADNTSMAISSLTPKSIVIGNGLFSIGDDRITNDPILISRSRFPDNLFVMLITALGIPGTLLVLYWGSQYLMHNAHNKPEILAIVALLLVHAQFQNTVVQPFVFIYFSGILLIYMREQRPQKKLIG